MMKRLASLILAALLVLCCAGCGAERSSAEMTLATTGDSWNFGFGRRQIVLLPHDGPLYIAGYHNGVEIDDILDYCEARAVWLDTGGEGILLIGIDCVALDSATVAQIRSRLADIPDCAAIHVFATHTHAGFDTLGLWGPVGIDGKNDAYMEDLICAAVEAAQEAARQRKPADMYFGQQKTYDLCEDSRNPQIFDPNLYQLRLEAKDGSAGLRMLFFGAHAESLRGDNTALSRDFPGQLCDGVQQRTGDDAIFCPGAIGGLIMTRELTPDPQENMQLTAQRLIEAALAISPEWEQPVAPELAMSRTTFTIPMDNPVFLLYRFLGILGTKVVPADSATDYGVETELSVLRLGQLAVTLIPGEIFPELVYGGVSAEGDPENLCAIAADYGIDTLLVLGLANDEIGYIVPPSDFLVHDRLPYLERVTDHKNEDHYEETNSLGPLSATCVAQAFEAALEAMQ